jgi:hypothetical protein
MESINTEDFISEIEAQPALWNTASKQYSNKMSKRCAWEEVMVKFDPLFKEKTAGEKNCIGKFPLFHVLYILYIRIYILHTFICFMFIQN